MGRLDLVVGDRAGQVLLDHVGLTLLDADEPIRDEDPITDRVGALLEKVELGRVAEPCCDEGRCLGGAFSLAKT